MGLRTADNSIWTDCPLCHNDAEARKTCPKIGCMNGRVLKK